MAASSPETPESERAARLRDTLEMNRRVCRELKEAVENCVSKGNGGCAEQAAEEAQPPSG